MLVKAIDQAMSEYVHKRLDAEATKLREEIGQLRADLTLARALMKGEISEIVRKDNRDVA
jgi:hypothetical protein